MFHLESHVNDGSVELISPIKLYLESRVNDGSVEIIFPIKLYLGYFSSITG